MSGQIQLINLSKEEFAETIIDKFKKEFDALKENYKPKEPEEYLTREQTAKLLNVNYSTLYKWTKSQKLKAYGIGNRVYYKRSEIEQSMEPLS